MKRSKEITDKDLVDWIKMGGNDRNEALKILLHKQKLKNILRRYILNNSGQTVDAENMLIEAILVLDKKVRRGSFDLTGSLEAYILNTAKLKWKNELRKKKPLSADLQKYEDIPTQESTSGQENENLKLVEEAMKSMSERCKQVLKYWQLNYPMEEIAEYMDFSSAAMARKNKYLCLKNLKKAVAELL